MVYVMHFAFGWPAARTLAAGIFCQKMLLYKILCYSFTGKSIIMQNSSTLLTLSTHHDENGAWVYYIAKEKMLINMVINKKL